MDPFLTKKERLEDFFENFEKYIEEATKEYREAEKDPYSYSCLPEYLQFDSWSHEEGLLLLADISPDEAIVEMGRVKKASNRTVLGARIHRAQILDIAEDTIWVPIEDELLDERKDLKRKIEFENSYRKNAQEVHKLQKVLEEVEAWLGDGLWGRKWAIYEQYSKKLSKIYRLWQSGDHPLGRLPKEYYIDWALGKKIEIRWFDWAEKNQLLPDSELLDTKAVLTSNVLSELQNIIDRIASEFPEWRDKIGIQNIKNTDNLMEWIYQKTSASTRDAELIKKALIEKFPELKKR